MNRMFMYGAVFATSILFLLGVVEAGQVDEKFDAITLGDYDGNDPASTIGATQWTTKGSKASIVGSASNPKDPFGGDANRSLRFYQKAGGGVSTATFVGDGFGAPRVGTLTMSFRMSGTGAYGYVRLGTGDSNGEAFDLRINGKDGSITLAEFDKKATNRFRQRVLDQTVSSDENHTLVVTFSAGNTYTVVLDGTILTDDNGNVRRFLFKDVTTARLDKKVAVYAGCYAAGTDAELFVDNIKVQPVVD